MTQPAKVTQATQQTPSTQQTPPTVSVIICCYTMERINDIHKAVNSILAQTLKPYEVILAVDHNQELYLKLKEELPSEVKVVLNTGKIGSAAARNVGIHHATGDIVAFIDDDAVAKEDWLQCLRKHYRNPHVVAVGGQAISIWSRERPYWFAGELDWVIGGTYKGHPEKLSEVRNLIWPNMSFRRKICERIGFIRTDIGALGKVPRSGDETEFCIRMKHLIPNAVILYEPRAIVYHKASPYQTTLSHLVKRSFREGFYKAKMSKHVEYKHSLSTESSYLRYLLFTSIPGRLRKFYKKGSLSQVGAIIISIAATGVGYLVGRVIGGRIRAGV